MELFDEDKKRKEKENNAKLNKIIISLITTVLSIIIILIIVIFILVKFPTKLTVNLNGIENESLEKLIEIEEAKDSTILINVPIKEFASYIGYRAESGEYMSSSQDPNKCNVISGEEVTTFSLDSNIIYKQNLKNENSDVDSFDIIDKVFEKDGVLYVGQEGLIKGFNLLINYNSKKKILDIYTLDEAFELIKNRVEDLYEYDVPDEKLFENKKAILDGMIIITSGIGNKKFGVLDYYNGKNILDIKYDEIQYSQAKSNFMVKINNKIGIMDINGKEKIRANYDDLVLIDNEKELYLAKNNDLYGIVNYEGMILIYLEYDSIGIDVAKYEQNGIKSGYLLLDELIPVKQGDKWGFFNLDGDLVTDFIYDNIGSNTKSKTANIYDVLAIEDLNVVIVERNGKYTFIDMSGKELLENVFNDIYLKISSGVIKYYGVWNEKEYNLEDVINTMRTN